MLCSHESLADLLKQREQYRLMSLDVGSKTIGVAFYRSCVRVAIPHKTLLRYKQDIDSDIKSVLKLVGQEEIDAVVIGMPVQLNREESESSRLVRAFTQKLLEYCDGMSLELPITFYDERFTTSMANQILKEAKMKRKQRNKVDNEVAAAIILENFAAKALL